MANIGEEIEAERKRLAPLQQRPEWLEWLALMESGLETFFATIVPNMPDDPWTEEGMRVAEAAALDYFPDRDSANARKTPENLQVIDSFVRYLGEVSVRCFEGVWMYTVDEDGEPEQLIVEPYSTIEVPIRARLTATMRRRTGNEWAKVFQRQAQAHRDWVEAGRPSLADWVDQQTRERRARYER